MQEEPTHADEPIALESLARRAEGRFRAAFGRPPRWLAASPGRVNLIGEHTDYNDGFVLPMAIDRWSIVAIAPRDDGRIIAASEQVPGCVEVRRSAHAASGARHWTEYIAAVVKALERDHGPIGGFEMIVTSDVPVGAGLSSSAALELATARALCAAN